MSGEDWQVVFFTVGTALLAVLIDLIPGVGIAWLLARREWPGKAVIEAMVTLPLVLPPVATGLVLLELFGRHGWIGGLFSRWGIEIVFTWKAVVLAMAVMAFPFIVRSARITLESVNLRLEHVASTLGASPLRVAWSITLPLITRGLLAGMVMAFARALGEFGATVLVAGNIPGATSVISTSIYSDILLGHDSHAFTLMGLAVFLAFVAIFSSEWLGRRRA